MPLSLRDIEKIYVRRNRFWRVSNKVLDRISLQIEEGETVGLMGDSGSGKSTLGRILAGLEPPTAGQVLYEGKDTQRMTRVESHQFRRSVQMVFQDPASALNPMKTVQQSMEDVIRLTGVGEGETKSAIDDMLTMSGLPHEVLERYPDQISGGQIQRVALVRVIFHKPRYLILDEPTSALDVSVQAQILKLLREIQQDTGMGCLFISHDKPVVSFISDRVIHLKDGQIR
ncbi:MAG: ABC transporter ATP-binding protein [Methanomicrobiales archaeon]|nr:ABC transporter ATP-binding protein [Methanomicrobiales archaeon]